MIVIIDDDIAVRTSLQLLLEQAGFETKALGTPNEATAYLHHNKPSLIILDMNFSLNTTGEEGLQMLRDIRKKHTAVPVILITGWATIELAVKGIKAGANDFINKPWNNEHLLQSVKTLLKLQHPRLEKISRDGLDKTFQFDHIVGEDKGLLSVLSLVSDIAGTEASVLIMGESGTGKELIAEAIHQNSQRINRPFIKVNLGGISSTLFESEMFGHVKGAFTDAKSDRSGRFEMANRGTIFLDEIGDLDLPSQVKLLRVLQDRTYEVLGSSKTRTVDVRVICATNKNLEEMIATGSFREDLYYRINLITIKLPSLRERPGDIPLLVNYFTENLRQIYERPALQFTETALQHFQQMNLPGNIRQLRNIVERSVLMSKKNILDVDDIRDEGSAHRNGNTQIPEVGMLTLEEIEKQMIVKTMEFYHSKITRVAKSLGITRSALYRRLEKYNIPFDERTD